MTHRRQALAGRILGTVALALTIGATSLPASAASPPVTIDDTGEGFAGNQVFIAALANDIDPDGDELRICDVPDSPYPRLEIQAEAGLWLVVVPKRSARPGQYAFTYFACDSEAKTEGTLIVTIKPEPDITVTKLKRPGRLKIRNPGNFWVIVAYGQHIYRPTPHPVVAIAKRDAVVIRVHRHRIAWYAYHHRTGEYLRHGWVKNIQLP
jgi:hypothetical protein